MKTITIISALISIFTLNMAFANEGKNNFYVGFKKSDLSVDNSFFTENDTTGILMGYTVSSTSAIEVEKSTYDVSILGIDTEMDTFAIYYAIRTEGEKYFKYKIGYLNEEISNSLISLDDTGLSYGLGGGIKSGKLNMELEYIKIEKDASSTNLNVIYNF